MQAKFRKHNHLIARSVVVGVALIIWLFFYQSYYSKSELYEQMNSQLSAEVKRFNSLNNQNEIAIEYKEKFESYMPVSQYENENRLYWLDVLKKIRIKHKIPSLKYSFTSRKSYNFKDGILKKKGLKVYVTDTLLSMGLMHEADLTAVIRDIQNIKKSVHVITSCKLKRLSKNSNKSRSGSPNIDAACELKLFTFKVI